MIAELDPRKVVQLLTQSARQLDATTLSALANARQIALGRQSVHAPVLIPATNSWAHSFIPHSPRQWVAAGLFAALLVAGTGMWQHSRDQQISELDVAILTDDLPIEVFVD